MCDIPLRAEVLRGADGRTAFEMARAWDSAVGPMAAGQVAGAQFSHPGSADGGHSCPFPLKGLAPGPGATATPGEEQPIPDTMRQKSQSCYNAC